MRLERLALIGNCQYSALVEDSGTVVWGCLPRFDSDPMFSTLLDEQDGGRFLVGAEDGKPGLMAYEDNTNILVTTFRGASGAFRVIDFAPRFLQYDRIFHPTQLFRIVEPLEGTPRVRVLCEPHIGFTKAKPALLTGSNHVRFEGFASQVRLTTDVPLSYLDGRAFALTEKRHLVFTYGAPVEEALAPLAERFLVQTRRYWQRWVKHCDIPPIFQNEVIRSALTLKLHCFEDTGAIVAAMTTSIPEAPKSGRTWDYRYCWLRDASYVLGAFRLLGQFDEREDFAHFLLNVAGAHPDLDLAPLYRIDGRSDLDEQVLADWPGFGGDGPVRVGNAAARHVQNDVFGEMVLALTPIFLDERFAAERSPAVLQLLERLARKAISVVGMPDAGIWEYRTEWKPQTFSSLMCWAAADRMARVAARYQREREPELRATADRIRGQIVAKAWNPTLGSFASTWGGNELDASLLQIATLHFLPPNDARIHATVDAIAKGLGRDGWLYRYRNDDGFGRPQVAFVLCTFWLVEALAETGRLAEAREILERVCSTLTPLGLISEDYDTATGTLWGNFPQAYSHVGLIHAAFAAAPAWSEVL
jgi:GH15 family glucan-1,4-alpha-glucosidase